MKKIQVLKAEQRDIEIFLLAYNPRELIKLVDIPEKGESQLAQRPWKESRVKEIAKYVAGKLNISENSSGNKKAKGFIPNCPILNILSPLKVIKENNNYFILLPETEEEIKSCFGKVEILDGQHRLISFSDEYIDPTFRVTDTYEMGFVILDNLTLQQKREIFMISNDKQEKVESNVLNQIKQWLGLLSEEDEKIYQLIMKLNIETSSPLRGKFNIGGKNQKSGLNQIQVASILKRSKLFDLLNDGKLDDEQTLKVIINYLTAWNEAYNSALKNSKHILSKISGFRFMSFLFPYIYDILKEQHKTLKQEDVAPLLETLFSMTDGQNLFNNAKSSLAFRSESATIKLSKDLGIKLKEYVLKESTVFNPAIF